MCCRTSFSLTACIHVYVCLYVCMCRGEVREKYLIEGSECDTEHPLFSLAARIHVYVCMYGCMCVCVCVCAGK